MKPKRTLHPKTKRILLAAIGRSAAALALAAKFYNEDQPRDESGRWTDGGGGGSFPDNSRIPAEYRGKPLPDHLRVLGPKGYDENKLKEMVGQAKGAGKELQEFTDRIKEQFGVKVDSGLSFKSAGSAEGKALVEMGGNVAGIKDMVRNTIMPDNVDKMHEIARGIEAEVKAMGGKVKYQEPDKYMGYRGYIVNVPASNGLMMEMQINTPEMMYAKDGHEKFVQDMIGEKRFNAIRQATGLEPGQGHKHYETWRSSTPGSPAAQAAIEASKKYYAKFYNKLG